MENFTVHVPVVPPHVEASVPLRAFDAKPAVKVKDVKPELPLQFEG